MSYIRTYPSIRTFAPDLDPEYYPLLLGRWFERTEGGVVGVCSSCWRVVPAQFLFLCLLPFGAGEEWRCDECPGNRVRTNGKLRKK
jgi:hypothetical protein